MYFEAIPLPEQVCLYYSFIGGRLRDDSTFQLKLGFHAKPTNESVNDATTEMDFYNRADSQ